MVASKGPSTQLIIILVCGMLFCGCSNSIWSKYQDMQCVSDCDNPDPAQHKAFEQPLFQTAGMFVGECLCLLAFIFINSRLNPFRPSSRAFSAEARRAAQAGHVNRLASAPLSRPDESAFNFNESAISLRDESRYDEENVAGGGKEVEEKADAMNWKKALLFWLPTVCDIMGTTAMNVGLIFVPVSVYQMLRGAIVLFVAILSIMFLGRKLTRAQWIALSTVMAGVAVVGLSSVGKSKNESVEEESEVDPLVGVVLILLAQIFAASQFVIEEKIMQNFSVDPLLAVGYEGVFGLSTTLLAFPILYHFIGSTPSGKGGYFDVPNGWEQVASNPKIYGSSVAIAISIAFFNFCGLAVTKSLSATARSTIDTCRTLFIWLVSMYLGWEEFQWLQVLGFTLLVYGTFVFNGIARFPSWTGFHHIEPIPTIILPSDEDDTEDESDYDTAVGRPRGLDDSSRPLNRRSGSGRRGEASPLLKSIDT